MMLRPHHTSQGRATHGDSTARILIARDNSLYTRVCNYPHSKTSTPNSTCAADRLRVLAIMRETPLYLKHGTTLMTVVILVMMDMNLYKIVVLR